MTYDLLQRSLLPPTHTFADLMPYRVREILLVSSSYDAYILEEDGPLTERLFAEYSELNLSWAPRLTHAPNTAAALDRLHERNFDLVLTTPRLADSSVLAFARLVKTEFPRMPVVCLLFNEADLAQFPESATRGVIDRLFMWTGDARSLISTIKLIEDWRNVEHDTRIADVRVVIVVEDSVRHYSSFLALLYTELMTQAASLIAEGVNVQHKLVRMRARPKVVLATTFEEAEELLTRYDNSLAALITDIRFPRGRVLDPEAGFKLVESVRRRRPELPILMQSAEEPNAKRAEALGLDYVDKNSPKVLRTIRRFLLERLGFGPFVFRLPNGSEVARAEDVYEMEQVLTTLPAESLEYHGGNNDFSRWLTARSMFALARVLRERNITSFHSIEDVRAFLVDFLRTARIQDQEGVLAEYSARGPTRDSPMVRLGAGSIGGKARGIAFINQLLSGHAGVASDPSKMRILVPRSVVIGTDIFEGYLRDTGLLEEILAIGDDRAVAERFLALNFRASFLRDLESAWRGLRGPLAVRSSSLLEDQQFRPFSGIYNTYMLPNNHPDEAKRFDELRKAIQAVYASTYSRNARSYVATTPYSIEEEKMGVVIQEMVGQLHGGRFYPHFAGVALSHNHYPIGGQKAEEGIALVALGLGHMVVSGGANLRFSPSTPGILPQFTSARHILQASQRDFYAVDMSMTQIDFLASPDSSLRLYGLDVAEADGTLAAVGSVYDVADDAIRDNLTAAGPRVVTFNNILKWSAIPLAETLSELLAVSRQGMGCEVELEFAVDMGDWGRSSARDRREPALYALQVRPLASHILHAQVSFRDVAPDAVLCRTDKALGHGRMDDIRDVVYIKVQSSDSALAKRTAVAVGEVNDSLQRQNAGYILIGPGRWGSSDPYLGIPVQWGQISGVRVIVETSFEDRQVEPSQGTHFFQNVTSQGIGYLTLSGRNRDGAPVDSYLDTSWLDAQPAVRDTELLRHVRLERPLRVLIDGHRGRAMALKPSFDDNADGA